MALIKAQIEEQLMEQVEFERKEGTAVSLQHIKSLLDQNTKYATYEQQEQKNDQLMIKK